MARMFFRVRVCAQIYRSSRLLISMHFSGFRRNSAAQHTSSFGIFIYAYLCPRRDVPRSRCTRKERSKHVIVGVLERFMTFIESSEREAWGAIYGGQIHVVGLRRILSSLFRRCDRPSHRRRMCRRTRLTVQWNFAPWDFTGSA